MTHDPIENRLARLERQNLRFRRALIGAVALAGLGAALASLPAVSQEPPRLRRGNDVLAPPAAVSQEALKRAVSIEENGLVLRSRTGKKVSDWVVDENGDVKLTFYGRTEEERIAIEVSDGEAWLSMLDGKNRTRMLIRTGVEGASDIRFNSEKNPVASLSVDEAGEAFLGVQDDAMRGFVVRAGKGGATLRLDRPNGTTWEPK